VSATKSSSSKKYSDIRYFGLFIYLPRSLDQETAKGPCGFRVKLPPCNYQSNHSKVEAHPLSTLINKTASELAGLHSHYPFNAECQAIGKL